MKKAELSINVIVVAAIGMIILVVLSVLVFDMADDLWSGQACENLGQGNAECITTPDCARYGENIGENMYEHSTAHCDQQGERCCVTQ